MSTADPKSPAEPMTAPDPESPATLVPAQPSLENLRGAIQTCRACELWAAATQPVLGSGERGARVMLVSEQPGDREDIEGRPFVGPAGGVLGRALTRAGIAAPDVYVTNVVKHFRYKARGKRRIHQKPDRVHVSACLPGLEAELTVIAPQALVCLGVTAAQALLGSRVRIGRDRGKSMDSELADLVTVTTHPSAILRSRTDAERHEALDGLVADLSQVATWLAQR